MKQLPILALLAFSFGIAHHAKAQTTIVTSDFELRSGLGLQKSLGEHFEVTLDNDFRFWQNATAFDKYISEVGVGYTLFNKHLTVGGKFRLVKDADESADFDTERRYSAYIKGAHNVTKRLEFKYRLLYQNENDFGESLSAKDDPTYDWRFKTTAIYNIKNWKLDPKVSVELWRSTDTGETEVAGTGVAGFDKMRFTAGTTYKIKRVGSIDAYYSVERELTDYYPATVGILGIGFTYDLDNLFKKKQD